MDMNLRDEAIDAPVLDADELMARARRQTGLEDFGDPWFIEPLCGLVGLINAEGGLTMLDVPPVQTLVDHLASRLHRVDYLKRNTAALDEEVTVAGLIIAHGRGGSTLLQRLLGSSPQLRSPRWFELLTPIPLPGEEPGHPAERIEIARKFMAQFVDDAPEMKAIHPMTDPMQHEEEVLLLNQSFMTVMYSALFNIPGNHIWQMQQNHARSYDELKQWLQILQFQAPEQRGRKWLLKAPHYLWTGDLDTVVRAFPDAKLLMTHRNLENVIGSLCSTEASMLHVSRPSNFDPRKLGPAIVEMYLTSLRNMMDFRSRHPADLFIDVPYRELTANPLLAFRRVMGEMGLTVTPADEQAARDWMAQNERHSFPPHRYALEDYGLSREEIAKNFAFYYEAFPEKL